MSIWRLVLKEILHRKLNFALALLSMAVAVGCMVGAMALLKAHDLYTGQILEAKQQETKKQMADLEDAMRKAMLGLGFNIVILPKDQKLDDWYANDSTSDFMPEEYVGRLAKSKTITVQHLLPILQERTLWTEKKRSIILVGTRGEIPGGGPKKAMMSAVPPGTIILGHELHDSLGLKVGDKLTFRDREFTVRQCYPMRGNKDDVTAWIDLKDAQDLLGRQGKINAIMALECHCALANLPKVREEIVRILPGTQVIERGSEALARAEVRTKAGKVAEESLRHEEEHRGRLRAELAGLTSMLVPLAMLAAVVWVALLALANVRDRRGEIGILRAIGVQWRQVVVLFLSKSMLLGFVGGLIGCLVGWLASYYFAARMEHGAAEPIAAAELLQPAYGAAAVLLAPVLAAAASWLPALSAANQDPAVVLREG